MGSIAAMKRGSKDRYFQAGESDNSKLVPEGIEDQKEAARRIFATTDKQKGALRTLAQTEGYETFIIPDEVGGRYSVLTAVGLLPIATAGIDIATIMEGCHRFWDLFRLFDNKPRTYENRRFLELILDQGEGR